jgi:iron(III) transport system permease protein
MSAVLPARAGAEPRQRAHWTDRIAHAALLLIVLALVLFLALPLASILVKSLQDRDGAFVGLINFTSYLATPSLLTSLWHSVWVALLVTLITLPLAFGFAYALSRSCMPFKGLVRTIALVPLLAPSLLSALSLIYWFGNQGIARGFIQALGLNEIYGAPGVVVAECFAVFPHTLMILITAL